jgi:hypothetical protein
MYYQRIRIGSGICMLALIAAVSVACGTMESTPALESITVGPASADAQAFPQGQVRFRATGTFSRPPSPAPALFVAPYPGSDVELVQRMGTNL